MNKFRTMYIGRAGLFVCTGVACLAINTERKKEAKQLADAAKAAAKKALQEMRFLPLAGHSWRLCRQGSGFDFFLRGLPLSSSPFSGDALPRGR